MENLNFVHGLCIGWGLSITVALVFLLCAAIIANKVFELIDTSEAQHNQQQAKVKILELAYMLREDSAENTTLRNISNVLKDEALKL